jgi:hypothetical protein
MEPLRYHSVPVVLAGQIKKKLILHIEYRSNKHDRTYFNEICYTGVTKNPAGEMKISRTGFVTYERGNEKNNL